MTKRSSIDVASGRRTRAGAGDAGLARKAAQPVRREPSPKWTCPRCGTRKLLRDERRG